MKRTFYTIAATELVGVVLTVLLIDTLSERRAIRARQEALITQLGSPDNAFATEAARVLRLKGWLKDGTLRGASLAGANLQAADLIEVDLCEARLWGANLQGAKLGRANLRGANLAAADLSGAHLGRADLLRAHLIGASLRATSLVGANLENAYLTAADLHEAFLGEANLQGTHLHAARNLTCAQLSQAETLQGATLPDGTVLPDDYTWRARFEAWCATLGGGG